MNITTISLIIFIILGLGLFFISCQSAQPSNGNSLVKDISKEELKKVMEENSTIQLVDVRTAKETKGGIIGAAKNIDYYANDFKEQIAVLNKNEAVYLYCRSGNRSGKAARILEELGYTEVYNLVGGYTAWSK